MVAEHLLWLQQHYWQSRYSVSFPRLRPCTGGIEPASIMDERQLVQTICAFRLLAPEIELSLSTRESPWFRDRVIPLAINNVSAFSKTQRWLCRQSPRAGTVLTARRSQTGSGCCRVNCSGFAAGMERLGQLSGTRLAKAMRQNVRT